MKFIDVTEEKREEYNKLITHPLQSFEWGEFRSRGGVKIVRQIGENKQAFTLTLHKVPFLPFTIGYLPKGNEPSQELITHLKNVGEKHNCIFIQMEPNITREGGQNTLELFKKNNISHSARPLFTKYSFILDLRPSEEELLKNFHPKTRYNIKVAEKYGVKVIEDNSSDAFQKYLKLTDVTTKRQKFYAHSRTYHELMWKTLANPSGNKNRLSAHLFTANYTPKGEHEKILTAWILFTLHDKIYYPYGASSSEHKNVMASNLMMWEAIRYGKKIGAKEFDMWGALGAEPDASDPWYGFHRFKKGYGARHTEFIGSYDLIINNSLYPLYKTANKIRWTILKKLK